MGCLLRAENNLWWLSPRPWPVHTTLGLTHTDGHYTITQYGEQFARISAWTTNAEPQQVIFSTPNRTDLERWLTLIVDPHRHTDTDWPNLVPHQFTTAGTAPGFTLTQTRPGHITITDPTGTPRATIAGTLDTDQDAANAFTHIATTSPTTLRTSLLDLYSPTTPETRPSSCPTR
jgi:hypothetical protein